MTDIDTRLRRLEASVLRLQRRLDDLELLPSPPPHEKPPRPAPPLKFRPPDPPQAREFLPYQPRPRRGRHR